MKLTKLSAAWLPEWTCRLMPAPSRLDAGTASQLIPGVRPTCGSAVRPTARVGGEGVVWLVLLLALSGGTPSGAAAPNASTDHEVASAVTTFLTAFENLDWNTFSAAFADD